LILKSEQQQKLLSSQASAKKTAELGILKAIQFGAEQRSDTLFGPGSTGYACGTGSLMD
jgi:hypothetical protein